MFWNKERRKKRLESVICKSRKFEVEVDEDSTSIEWTSIDKLIGFKLDLLTFDCICLKIEFGEEQLVITEEFDGWQEFITELLNQFPTIDKNWVGKISKPAFERNETELFNRIKNVG